MDDFSGSTSGNWQEAVGPGQMFGYAFSDLQHFGGYITFAIVLNLILFGAMIWLFNSRWRVSISAS